MYVIPVEFDLIESDGDIVKKKINTLLKRMLVYRRITKTVDNYEKGYFVHYFKCKNEFQTKHLSMVLATIHNITLTTMKNSLAQKAVKQAGYGDKVMKKALEILESGQDIRIQKVLTIDEWDNIKSEINKDNGGY